MEPLSCTTKSSHDSRASHELRFSVGMHTDATLILKRIYITKNLQYTASYNIIGTKHGPGSEYVKKLQLSPSCL